MTSAEESTQRPLNGSEDREVVGDGTDPQATDVSSDIDAEMLRDDVQEDRS